MFDQMLLIDGELDEDNIPASLEYDKKVIEIKAAIQNQKPCGQNVAATEQLKGPIEASTPTEDSTVESVQVHLRQIPLPTFEDKVSEWLSSWATFELVEHDNTRMNEIAEWCPSDEDLVGDAKGWIASRKPSKRMRIGCLEHEHTLDQCKNQNLSCTKCSGHHRVCDTVKRRSAGTPNENNNKRQWHEDDTPR